MTIILYVVGAVGLLLTLATIASYGLDLSRSMKSGSLRVTSMSTRTRLLHRALAATALVIGAAIISMKQ